jgi:hypothetical protein
LKDRDTGEVHLVIVFTMMVKTELDKAEEDATKYAESALEEGSKTENTAPMKEKVQEDRGVENKPEVVETSADDVD